MKEERLTVLTQFQPGEAYALNFGSTIMALDNEPGALTVSMAIACAGQGQRAVFDG